MCSAVEETNIETFLAVMNTTELLVEIRPEKNSCPYGFWTSDLCNTGAALYQLSKQANWEPAIMLLQINPPCGE